ncbi:hypothetical protein ACLKA6_018236 [Drosophila palustris]
MDRDDLIVISDEEEPQPNAHVEDCDSDEAQPRQSPRRGQRQRDPRRGRPNYGGRRQEERPRRYRHTVYHGTHRSVEECMAVEYSTMFIEVPQARNSPSYVEEPPSPPRFPALSESGGAPKSEASRDRRLVTSPMEVERVEKEKGGARKFWEQFGSRELEVQYIPPDQYPSRVTRTRHKEKGTRHVPKGYHAFGVGGASRRPRGGPFSGGADATRGRAVKSGQQHANTDVSVIVT